MYKLLLQLLPTRGFSRSGAIIKWCLSMRLSIGTVDIIRSSAGHVERRALEIKVAATFLVGDLMAAQSNAQKVFVALPGTYEDGLSVLSWVLRFFPQDKTKIIITRVVPSPFNEGSYESRLRLNKMHEMDLVLDKYISHCATSKFQAEKLVHIADDIAEGIVQVIAKYGSKNLVMSSAADSDMMDLASNTAKKVRQEANLSCKLWFISDGTLIFTREVNNLTPAPTSEGISHMNIRRTEASSSTSARSYNISTTEENKLAKNLQLKEQEIRELREILQMENQEMVQLRQELEEVTRQRDEYLNQKQVEIEKRQALEDKLVQLEVSNKDLTRHSSSNADHNETLQQEIRNLGRQYEQLSSSSTALNSEFSFEELKQATENFSQSLKIGEGAFGPVYKGSLYKIPVAIKMLRTESVQGIAQFQQEITILTKVRHPNLVNLMGACSEKSALVYEYLSNGSLEDRLTCANNTAPLTWQVRTRIIGEICLALIFLHSNKPKLVVHGDLKPGNILLDTNMVSKLSDFGISRLLKQPDTNSTACHETSRPAGTFSYTDPEYYSTGKLNPKSDIYSFGIIILRLLTGKPPMNIAGQVKDAMRNGTFFIDETAGAWPSNQAIKLAKIALRCAEIDRSRRPDLVNEVWTDVLEPSMKAASTYMEPQSRGSELGEESIPAHFICPISQEVMKDPHIAADGFTYEAVKIREWFRIGHNTSPMTNLPLPNLSLTKNHAIRSAIQEWLQKHPQS